MFDQPENREGQIPRRRRLELDDRPKLCAPELEPPDSALVRSDEGG